MKNYKVLFTFFAGLLLFALAVGLYHLNDSSEIEAIRPPQEDERAASGPVQTKTRVDRGEGEVAQKELDSAPERDTDFDDGDFERSLEQLRSFCFTHYPEYRESLPEEEIKAVVTSPERLRVWANFHIESPRGDVYRIRRFLDDGENMPLERLVFFKEDETGFPEIVEIPEEHQVNPSEEVVVNYLERGELIYSGQAYTVDQGGESYFFEVENGEIVRFDIASERGLVNCQRPRE